MSVIVTLWIQGDPDKLESVAGENPDRLRAIADQAKEHGAIAHRFYGSKGQILVIDEWPDEESFQRFFEDQRPQIEPLLQEVGSTAEPRFMFWRKLETHDEIGWGA